jgi:hypothetical protein
MCYRTLLISRTWTAEVELLNTRVRVETRPKPAVILVINI